MKAKAWTRRDPRTKKLHPRDQRWQVQYIDPETAKARTKGGFSTKDAATTWRNDFLNAAHQGNWIDPAKGAATFREFALEWHAVQHFDKANTANGYKRIIEGERSLLNIRFGNTPLNDISHEAITRWVKDCAERRSPTTVRNNFYVLRKVLDYAVDTGRISRDPSRNIKNLPSVKKAQHAEEDRYPLTVQEVERIIDALPQPWDLYTRLVARTGMRPEEAAALRLSDLDLENGHVKIRGVIVDLHGEQHREERAKNDHSRRTIDLDDDTTQKLSRYTTQHRKNAARFFTSHPDHKHPGDDLPLFAGVERRRRANPGQPSELERFNFSRPMRHKTFYSRHWKRAVKAAGLPETLRFYDLRHLHASMLVDRLGQPGALTLKEVQDRLGHASAVMTLDRYAHSQATERDRKRKALGDMFAADPDAATNVTQLHG